MMWIDKTKRKMPCPCCGGCGEVDNPYYDRTLKEYGVPQTTDGRNIK